MRRAAAAVFLLASAAACARLKEAPDALEAGDAGDAGGGEGLDAGDGAPASAEAGAQTPDGGGSVRLVFVTSAQLGGGFAAGASSPWVAADDVCAEEALANSLPGSFVAWLSFTKSGTEFNAASRIADAPYSLPGIVADGGAPLLVAASRAELLSEGPRVPMTRLASGEPVPPDENEAVSWVWTGTLPNGSAALQDCSAWTDATSARSGVAGNARRIPQYEASDWTSLGGRTCDQPRRFYCFQK